MELEAAESSAGRAQGSGLLAPRGTDTQQEDPARETGPAERRGDRAAANTSNAGAGGSSHLNRRLAPLSAQSAGLSGDENEWEAASGKVGEPGWGKGCQYGARAALVQVAGKSGASGLRLGGLESCSPRRLHKR